MKSYAYSKDGLNIKYRTEIKRASFWSDKPNYQTVEEITPELIGIMAAKMEPGDWFVINQQNRLITTDTPLFLCGELTVDLIMIGETEVYNKFKGSQHEKSIKKNYLTHKYL